MIEGFPLIGEIPVDPSAPRCPLRSSTVSEEDLVRGAPELAAKLAAKARAFVAKPEFGEASHDSHAAIVLEVDSERLNLTEARPRARPEVNVDSCRDMDDDEAEELAT